MRWTRLLLLALLSLSFATTICLPGVAQAFDFPFGQADDNNNDNNSDDNDDNDDRPKGRKRYVDAYLGLAIVYWGYDNESEAFFQDIIETATPEPYVMKVLEINFANLWGFELGLNYMADKLNEWAGFSTKKDLVAEGDPISRALAGELSYNLQERGKEWPNVTLSFNATFRQFQWNVDVRNSGLLNRDNPRVDFFPLGGGMQSVLGGEKLTFTSTYRDYELGARYGLFDNIMFIKAVYKHLDYTTPLEVLFMGAGDDVSMYGRSLMMVDNRIRGIMLTVGVPDPGMFDDEWEGPMFGFSFSTPFGTNYGYTNYFSTSSTLAFTWGGDVYIGWKLKDIAGIGLDAKIVLGAEAINTVVMSGNNLAGDPVTLDRDIIVNGNALSKGAKVHVDYMRMEGFMGPYFHLAMSY